MDKLKMRLDMKEDERKLHARQLKNDLALDNFDDDGDMPREDIIDEEELIMLREMKELKRDYRDNFSKLKGLKQEMASLTENIDKAKEQIIFLFESWYAETFENPSMGQVQQVTFDPLGALDKATSSKASNSGEHEKADIHQFEDEDAAVYRRAKFSIDELHRARKFEKSIKLC
jgi:hypothetical protein